MQKPTLQEDRDLLAFHFDMQANEYSEEDHDDPEWKDLIQAGVRLTSHLKRLEHVAWCRYSGNSIVTCDSDSKGAFKVYRHPLGIN